METTARRIGTGPDTWEFDDDDEFFAAYEKGFELAEFHVTAGSPPDSFSVTAYGPRFEQLGPSTEAAVARSTRGEIERVLSIFGERADSVRTPTAPLPLPPPTIFIGHGHNQHWRDLKDHLHDQHGYEVEAYETGARAGHTVRDILERMMELSSFAILVMTAEDEQADGSLRTRQNVVHEAGLFQGRLGFDRAIVAREDGIEPFSNLEGVHQLGFGAGNIREVFGDVLATLRREFPK
jgi:predicted nucleotide-binding protein